MKRMRIASLIAFPLLLLVAADIALASDLFILATGRRDPRIYAIDFNAALKRHNNNTSNAIVSRSKVHPDRLDGTPVGDPANIVLSEDRRTAYVVNHHGPVNNAEFLQHGGRGSVSVMDVRKMLRPEFDDTDRAVERNYDSGYFGAVAPRTARTASASSTARPAAVEDRSRWRWAIRGTPVRHSPCLSSRRLRLRWFLSRLPTRCLAAGRTLSSSPWATAATGKLTFSRETRVPMTYP